MSDDYDWEENLGTIEGSHPESSGSTEEIAGLLVELTVATLKAAILLAEMDETEWNQVAPRLGAFLQMVGNVPREPTKRAKRVGFKVDKKAKKSSRRKKAKTP